MVEAYRFDKQGKRILPTVHLGNERLSSRAPTGAISGPGFVLCEEHGTVPIVWVRTRLALVKCCRHCIRHYCSLTQTIPDVADAPEHPNGPDY